MLPDMSGLDVLRKLREQSPHLPVLLLTAKDAVEDRIAGLTAGGDDYVTKPFSIEEVVLRLRALLRRTGRDHRDSGAQIVVGDLVLDEDSHEVTRAGEPVALTATEFELLRFLMRNPQAGAVQGADPGPGVELRLRRAVQHRRALHLLPAQEDRQRARADDPHRCAAPATSSSLRASTWSLRGTAAASVRSLLLAAVCVGIGGGHRTRRSTSTWSASSTISSARARAARR